MRRLSAQNLVLQSQAAFLVEEAQFLKAERDAKLALRHKRSNARKIRVRDAMTAEEFKSVFSLVKGHSYVNSRIRIAIVLLLLYYTGLRVSNLLVLKRCHLYELLNKQHTNVPMIKGGPQRHFITIGSQGRQYQ